MSDQGKQSGSSTDDRAVVMRVRMAIAMLFGMLLSVATHADKKSESQAYEAQGSDEPQYPVFQNPQRVSVRGYDGDIMEPFVSRDGKYLFFNNRNDPPEKTDLFYAERGGERNCVCRGKIQGANSPALDAVPSMDRDGNFYFVTTRSYDKTLSTIYRGRFAHGEVTGAEPVSGVSRGQRGQINFDNEISADGEWLYFVDGEFSGGPLPRKADLVLAKRSGNGFERIAKSQEYLRNVNTEALEYAPATAADGLELFFTRLDVRQQPPRIGICRAARKTVSEAFGRPERVTAAEGFVEAPALSPDGMVL